MKHRSKLSQEQQESRQVGSERQSQSTGGRDFASVEDMLRYDAAHTPVPPEIVRRLQKSTSELPGPKPAWWKRFFGGTQP